MLSIRGCRQYDTKTFYHCSGLRYNWTGGLVYIVDLHIYKNLKMKERAILGIIIGILFIITGIYIGSVAGILLRFVGGFMIGFFIASLVYKD